METANSSMTSSSVKESVNGSTSIQDLRDDLNSIKANMKNVNSDLAALAHDLKHGGSAILKEGIDQVKTAGKSEFQRVEDHVREKPGQSIALAFCAGLVFSLMLGRR